MADPTPITLYYQQLTQAVQAMYGNLINGTPYPIQAGAQGDFAYYFSNPGQTPPLFNQWTDNFITPNASASTSNPGCIQLGSSGSFEAAYLQLVTQITYKLSQTDQQNLQNALNAAVNSGNALVQQYQSVIGPITAAQIAAATAAMPGVSFTGTQGNINYVLNFILGSVWSGSNPPLSWTTMLNAQNLASYLPNMPAAGSQVLPAVTLYLNAVAAATPLNDELNLGIWTVNQIKQNLQSNRLSYPFAPAAPTQPGPAGMQTFDPATQANQYAPNYNIPKSPVQIVNDLSSSNAVSVSIEVTQSGSSEYSLSINGSAAFKFGGPFLTYSLSGSTSYDLATVQGAGSAISITLTYKGFSNVPVQPQAWSGTQWGVNSQYTAGWYYPQLVQEAYANFSNSNPPSGFIFTTPPPFNLAAYPNGNFNTLTNVLICNYPTVTVNYSAGNYSSFSQVISAQSSGSVKLFGFIPLGSASMSTYSAQRQAGSSNSSFALNFAAPSTAGVPTYQQTAYVIGGLVSSVAAPASVLKSLVRTIGV